MEAICSFETSVSAYRTTRYRYWEDHSLNSHCCENLKTYPLKDWGLSVGRLICCWASPAQSFLASDLVAIYDQDFCSLLDMYGFRSGGLLFDEGRGRSVAPSVLFFPDGQIAAGPRQHSHCWFRVLRDSWPYFTVWRLCDPSEHSVYFKYRIYSK
jgi:hypothetical protein